MSKHINLISTYLNSFKLNSNQGNKNKKIKLHIIDQAKLIIQKAKSSAEEKAKTKFVYNIIENKFDVLLLNNKSNETRNDDTNNSYRKIQNYKNKETIEKQCFCVIFTTLIHIRKADRFKKLAQENVLHALKHLLRHEIEIIIFTQDMYWVMKNDN